MTLKRGVILNKKLSLILVSITLTLGGGYFLCGKIIQKNYYETIAKLNAKPNMKVNLVSYERGFLSSTANVTLEIGTDNPADIQVVALKQVITHGPIIAANTQDGHSLKFWQRKLRLPSVSHGKRIWKNLQAVEIQSQLLLW